MHPTLYQGGIGLILINIILISLIFIMGQKRSCIKRGEYRNMNSVIEVIGVNKNFKDHAVLKNINLTVNKGEICGIIGRNGSGKTVLLKCICKIFLEDSGEIRVFRRKYSEKTGGYRKNLGVLIENPAFLENFSGIGT